jgi:hypothetical protein
MKRDAQEALLITGRQHPARDVEKGSSLQLPVLHDADSSRLLDHEDPPVVEWLRKEYGN